MLVAARRHVVGRNVGQPLEPALQFLVETLGLGLTRLQALFQTRDFGHQRIGRLTLALGKADLLAERLAAGLRRLALRNRGAAALVDLQDLGRDRREATAL